MKLRTGDWLRIPKDERSEFGDNLIRVNGGSNGKYDITYFFDWEIDKFTFDNPSRNKKMDKEFLEIYKEYTPKELIVSIFEDPMKGTF